ncbi:MAG: ferritin [Methanomicrobiaceae archaeon]|uniref:Ferritin-like protein 2 n=1 Tax=hydrocarbon metagenome TaxID=938273 RepID=A0A0W8FHL9_9ZZZZ|nr:ferritin [Methanomicrobiaceae archaeon]MDD5419103.1 ferritin [Methanomicrobiaceae archaeon]
MISQRMGDAINEQVMWEMYSAYLYLSMSAYFESTGLRGFAHWMRVQAREELGHAMKLYDHLVDRGYRITLLPIDAPPGEWNSPEQVFFETYEHEQKVTGLIDGLMQIAREENDGASQQMLRWFVDEQEEEEESALGALEKVRAAGGESERLAALDRELGQRTFHAPE